MEYNKQTTDNILTNFPSPLILSRLNFDILFTLSLRTSLSCSRSLSFIICLTSAFFLNSSNFNSCFPSGWFQGTWQQQQQQGPWIPC